MEVYMLQYRRLRITLGVVALLLLSFGAAAAKEHDTPKPPHGRDGHPPHGRPARLTWTPRRITQTVTAGQTVQLTASFVSSANINEARLVIPGQLGKVLKADSAKLTNITAGTPMTVTFTVSMPVTGSHSQGGIVLIRAGQRVIAQPLQIRLKVAKANDGSRDDTTEPSEPTPQRR
jgi:hypothetical protein